MTAQVYQFNVNEVYEDIMGFINLGHHSKNTKISYEKGIRDFFTTIKSKDIEYLTLSDLVIKKKDVEKFRAVMQEKGLANSSINNKVAAIRKLYDELVSNEYQLNNGFFKSIKKLPEKTKSYGFFTENEAYQLLDYVLEERDDAEIKYFYLAFCVETCIRKEAALNLTWSDFEIVDDLTVKINAEDKGNKHYRAVIEYGFYKDLLSIKKDSEKVFNISATQIDKMMPRLIKKVGLDPSRRLTFHSLRKTGVDYKFNDNGRDIRVAQKAANHSPKSLNVTVGTYLTKDDYGVKGMISKMYEKEENILESLNLEQLQEVLKSLDNATKSQINKKAKEIFGKNNDI